MAKNVNHIQHIKSSVVVEENGALSPKLPTPSAIVEGEIAVNFAEGYETLSIKNNSGDIVTFSCDDKFYDKTFIDNKLGSGFTGENSATTVTQMIEENELVTSSALNDLNASKADISAVTDVQDDISELSAITTAHTENTTIHLTSSEKSNLHSHSNKSALDSITGSVGTMAYESANNYTDTATTSALNNVVTAHTANTTIHLTSTEKEQLHTHSNKSALDSITGSVGTMAYENVSLLDGYADSVLYNSTSHKVEFYHGTTSGTKVFEFDASAFIIDGMVDNVEIDDVTSGSSTVKCLVVSFNTDADKQDINIPLSDIFDPDEYYTKQEVDTALSGKVDTTEYSTFSADTNDSIDDLSGQCMTIAYALNDLNDRKMDASAYTPTDLSNYYTKSETSGASEIEEALSGKVNFSDVVSAITAENSGSTNPVSVRVVSENELITSIALNDLAENKLDVTAYTPTDLSDYYTKSETSGATEISTALTAKADEDKLGETIHYLTSMTGTAGDTNLSASWSGNSSEITELYTGLCVRFLIPTAGHASGITLSINGGEKHKVLYNSGTTLTTQYGVNTVLNLTYDADTTSSFYSGSSTAATVQGVWRTNAEYYVNTNTIGYEIGHNQKVYKANAATYRYMLLLQKDETTLTPVNTKSATTAGTKTLTTESFIPFGDIIYYSSTSAVAANTVIGSGLTWTQHSVNLAYSFNTTDTLISGQSVYIVAVPQSDGKAKLHSSPISQVLPTTEDGLIYIYLGQAYSTTNIYLMNNHPIYYYKDGQLRLYTNGAASVVVDQVIDSGTSASTNAVATQAVYNTLKDTELVWTNAYNTLSGVVSSHTHASSGVTSMDGYSKPSTTSAISTSDTLNGAIGKLECALGGIKLVQITQTDYDNLGTKDPNTLYIITT